MIKKRRIKLTLVLLPVLAISIFMPSFKVAATRLPEKERHPFNISYQPVNRFSEGVEALSALQDSTPSPTAPIVIPGLQTATPAEDGSVSHLVGEGQTLWSIAVVYGVTIAEIRSLNGMLWDNEVIVPGQTLKIFPPNPDITDTPNPEVASANLTATAAIENPVVVTTVTPEPTFTASPSAFVIPVSAEERMSKPASLLFPLVGVLLIVAGFVLRSMVKRQRF